MIAAILPIFSLWMRTGRLALALVIIGNEMLVGVK
jgi:hypothetical protein